MEYLIVEGFDPNAVPGQNLVVSCFNYSISYKTAPGIGKTQTLTIAYHDSSGAWLVGAEPEIMATLPDPKQTLDEVVAADRGAWESYRYSRSNDTQGQGRGAGWKLGSVPPGIWVALQAGAPLPAQYLPFPIEGDCVGLKPEPVSSLGPMRASQTSSVWYGDNLGISLSAIAVEVDDVRRS